MTFQTIRIPQLSLSLLFALGAGCTLQKGDLGAYEGTESTGGGSSGETSTSGEPGTSEGPPQQTTSTEALTSHGPGDESTTGTPWPGCSQPEEGTEVDVQVSAPTLIDPEAYPIEFDVRCSVQGAVNGEIALQCTDDLEGIHAVTLTLTTETPHTGLFGGETDVRLSYREANDPGEFELDKRTYVALHAVDDGDLLLFYGRGYYLFPEQFAAFWAPMGIIDGELFFCPALEDGACGTSERTMVNVAYGEEQLSVYDGNVETFEASSMWFYAEEAVEYVHTNPDCLDGVYGRRVEVLALKADL
jgi:hypothetical protein